MRESGLFPISAVAKQTGINAVTLRAWERRYGLINPTRTPSGHRLYTGSDIEKIKLILQLLDEGVAISRVKEALRIAHDGESAPAFDTDSGWRRHRQAMLRAVADFDEANLERLYNEVMSLYPVDVVTRRLLLPLLDLLGERWQEMKTGIAEEHFFSVFMRNKLGARFHHRNTQNSGPLLVAACLPGEQHEFGLLLFALAAHARGYRLILLGADMPLAPLAEVVRRTACQGIVLSGSVACDGPVIQEDLDELCRTTKIPVLVGGASSKHCRRHIEAAGAVILGEDLTAGMQTLSRCIPIGGPD